MKIPPLLILLVGALTASGQNLIVNPDAELPLVAGTIPAWVATRGAGWTTRSADPLSQSGQHYFYAGTEAEAELTQVINVSDYACGIDGGLQTFQFTGYVRAYPQDPADQSQIIIELLSNQDALLATFDSGLYSGVSDWTLVSRGLKAPAGTRKVRVRLLSHRRNGNDNDGYFDNLSLEPMPNDKGIKVVGITSVSATCGSSDGSLVVQTANGTGRIFYSLDGITFQSSNTYTGLAAGAYTITVKDQSSAGCTALQRATIAGGQPPRIQAIASVSATCGQADGSLTVQATGTGTLQYALDGGGFQANPTFPGLPAGTYSISVTDASNVGCPATQMATVGGGSTPRIQGVTTTSATCGQADGSLTVTATGGSGPPYYSLDGVTFQAGNTFSGLAGGVYIVRVTDQSSAGCTATRSVTLSGGGGPRIQDVTTTPATCGQANGSLTVSATGTGGLQYALDGGTVQTANTFANLAGGVYTLRVTDGSAAGCPATQTVTLPGADGPRIGPISTVASSCGQTDGSAVVQVAVGSGPVRYSLDGVVFQASNTFTQLAQGSYTLTVQDALGCQAGDRFEIPIGCLVYAPDAFTPNHDGLNDYFQFFSAQSVDYRVEQLVIYNRWGEVIFLRQDFSILAGPAAWWDGSVQGEAAPAGAYPYAITYVHPANNNRVTLRGRVLLIR